VGPQSRRRLPCAGRGAPVSLTEDLTLSHRAHRPILHDLKGIEPDGLGMAFGFAEFRGALDIR
jgi:hypothetical protein